MRAVLIDAPDATALRAARRVAAAEVAALHRSLDVGETARATVGALVHAADAAACGLWLAEDDRITAVAGALEIAGTTHVVDGFAGRAASLTASAARALASRRPVATNDAEDRSLVPSGGSEPLVLVPLHRGGRVLALAALAAADSDTGVADVETIARYAAAAIDNSLSFGRQAAALAQVERRVQRLDRTALTHERDRIAADVHDTAGQLFVAIRLLARREAEKLPGGSAAALPFRRLAELADQGKCEIDHAIDALAFFPAARHGLAPAIRALAASFQTDGELDVIVDVSGRSARLPAKAERALYRVVHEWLANAWRHSRCSVVRVALAFEKGRVQLTVTDDGTGLTQTIPDRGRVGTNGMRRAIAEAGGSFRIRNGHPCGVVVEAEIPEDRR